MGGYVTEIDTDWIPVGAGVATSFPAEVEGRLVEIRTAPDVLAVVEEVGTDAWEPTIVLVHEAGGTTLGPLLGDVVGVISTKGTLGAHVALLTKEYGCPCVVGARLDVAPEGIARVRLSPDGSLLGRVTER